MSSRPWRAWILALIGAAIVALAAVIAVNPRIITAYNRGLLGIARGVAEAGAGALAGGEGEERTPVVTQFTQTPASTQTAPTVAVAETQTPTPVSSRTPTPISTPGTASPTSVSPATIQVPTLAPSTPVPTTVPPTALPTPAPTAPMPDPGVWYGLYAGALEFPDSFDPESFLLEFEVSADQRTVTLRSLKWKATWARFDITVGPEVPTSDPAPIVWGGKYNGFVAQTQYGELRGWFTSATTAEGGARLETERDSHRYISGDIEWIATAHIAPTPQRTPTPQPTAAFDTSQVVFHRLFFAAGVTADDQPTQILDALPSGVKHVCAFWDYEGMVNNVTWEAQVYVDGELSEEMSILDRTWTYGESGNAWVCANDDRGVPDGLYEVVLSVEGEVQRAGAVFVGGYHPSTQFTIVNESSTDVCYVFVPPAGTLWWDPNRLDEGEWVGPGASRIWSLPAAIYDLRLEDCDREVLAEEHGLDLAQVPVYTLTD